MSRNKKIKRTMNNLSGKVLSQFKGKKAVQDMHNEGIGTAGQSRRKMLKSFALVPVMGIPLFGILKKHQIPGETENGNENEGIIKSFDTSKLEGVIPKGKIKNLEISRLIAGGNQVSGIVSSPDYLYLTDLIKNYYTIDKAIEYLGLCEASGINTAILRCDDHILSVLKEYWRRGGKIQWLAQTYPENEDMTNIKIAIDAGASGAFVMGGVAEKLLADNRIDCLAKDIEFIRSQGIIAGTAGHQIEVPLTCIKNGIVPDFFMKTFHHLDYPMAKETPDKLGKWEKHPEEVLEFFRTSKVPWIAYKVLAKGAIKPESAFKYIFEKGADFACVGMFDFQVVANSNTITKVINSGLQRERQWYA